MKNAAASTQNTILPDPKSSACKLSRKKLWGSGVGQAAQLSPRTGQDPSLGDDRHLLETCEPLAETDDEQDGTQNSHQIRDPPKHKHQSLSASARQRLTCLLPDRELTWLHATVIFVGCCWLPKRGAVRATKQHLLASPFWGASLTREY